MQPVPPCSASALWWRTRVSGLLLHWELWLGAYSVVFLFVCLFVCISLLVMLPSEIPKLPTDPPVERVSWCLETSASWLPPRDESQSLTLSSLFLSFISCLNSFWREWAVFLGAWCPLPAFRSFVEVTQHSNDLLMNLWGRKWSPHPIPLPS